VQNYKSKKDDKESINHQFLPSWPFVLGLKRSFKPYLPAKIDEPALVKGDDE